MTLISYKIAEQIMSYLNLLGRKNIKYKTLRESVKYYTRNLSDAQHKRYIELNKVLTENDNLKLNLVNSTTWMKVQLILFSAKR